MRQLFIAILLFGFYVQTVFAQVVITEIMYDLSGADSGREWIEIQNLGAEPIDLSKWRLYEQDTNHTLRVISGSALLEPDAYAIIADNAEKFSADWPRFSGTIFDSSFSLKNDGEALILRDGDLHDVNSVTYSSSWGAGGNGRSLQLVGGVWIEGEPTPGAMNKASPPPVAAVTIKESVSEKKIPQPEAEVTTSESQEKDIDDREIGAGGVEDVLFSERGQETGQGESGGLLRWILPLLSVLGVGATAAIIFRRERPRHEIEILE